MKAITDAGLKPHDIDGIIPPPLPSTAEHFAANLGIEDLRYSVTVHMGGASPVTSLQSAAMAIACGVAKNVLVPLGWNGYSSMRVSSPQSDNGAGVAALGTTIGEYYLPYGPLSLCSGMRGSLTVISKCITCRMKRWALSP